MTTFVINREDAQKEVTIVFPETGRTDTICIQPFSKAALPEGSEVTDEFLKMNPKVQLAVSQPA